MSRTCGGKLLADRQPFLIIGCVWDKNIWCGGRQCGNQPSEQSRRRCRSYQLRCNESQHVTGTYAAEGVTGCSRQSDSRVSKRCGCREPVCCCDISANRKRHN